MISYNEAHDALYTGRDALPNAEWLTLKKFIDQHRPREHSGDWMQTFSGGRFYPLAPKADDIHLDDIAKALSRICRFAGHTERFYSVAQHSVYVSAMVPPEFAMVALMHDAPEAYIVDVPRPLKKSLPGYAEIEQGVWLAVAEKFGLPEDIPACVKDADNRVLLAEKDQLLKPGEDWGFNVPPAPIQITRMTDDQAYLFFLRRYQFIARGFRL